MISLVPISSRWCRRSRRSTTMSLGNPMVRPRMALAIIEVPPVPPRPMAPDAFPFRWASSMKLRNAWAHRDYRRAAVGMAQDGICAFGVEGRDGGAIDVGGASGGLECAHIHQHRRKRPRHATPRQGSWLPRTWCRAWRKHTPAPMCSQRTPSILPSLRVEFSKAGIVPSSEIRSFGPVWPPPMHRGLSLLLPCEMLRTESNKNKYGRGMSMHSLVRELSARRQTDRLAGSGGVGRLGPDR